MSDDPGDTIVEYFEESEGHKCGYCKGKTTNFSNGMWAHRMTVQDYQDLIDRGWRRSGCYCYKPIMKITCCPHYPIRCKATEFKLSHSQKKVLKKMRSFLISGKRPGDSKNEGLGTHSDSDAVVEIPLKDVKPREKQLDLVIEKHSAEKIPQKKVKLVPTEQKTVKPGATVSSKAKSRTPEKSLEDFVGECSRPNAVHHLQTTLVKSSQLSDELFVQHLEEEHTLYVKYQVAIHNDKPEKCTLQQFTKFLVNSPLNEWIPADGPPKGYGSFHQQYRIDGKLVAVAVLDILPHCVSSVYFFYDPEYSFLSLGTYSSLREIGLVRELSTKCPELCWYYLGYYIHTCPKMRYKRQYNPSYLACPETYRWVTLPDCLPRLEQSKYSRLDPDDKSVDENLVQDLGEVLILHKRRCIPYSLYKLMKPRSSDEDEVREYANLVGKKCSSRMLLYRH